MVCHTSGGALCLLQASRLMRDSLGRSGDLQLMPGKPESASLMRLICASYVCFIVGVVVGGMELGIGYRSLPLLHATWFAARSQTSWAQSPGQVRERDVWHCWGRGVGHRSLHLLQRLPCSLIGRSAL